MSFDSIQTATDRKTVCDGAVAEQSSQNYIDAQIAAEQTALQSHFQRRIIAWCDSTSLTSAESASGSLDLAINETITSSVLDTWQTDLQAKGYTVTRSGVSFKIELV